MSSDAFWKFSSCTLCKKSSGRIFLIFASKNEAVCREAQTHFGSSRLARFMKNVLGAFSRFVRPITKLFAVKFRRISELLWLQVLQKKFWALLHDLCVQKWSSLLWSSDAFWKFSSCTLCKKSSGRIFPIFASKNEAVCHEVQAHFGSSRLARFVKNVLGAFSRFVRPKAKLFAV